MTRRVGPFSRLFASLLTISALTLVVLRYSAAWSQVALCKNAQGSGTFAYMLSLPATTTIANSTDLLSSIPNATHVSKLDRATDTFWRYGLSSGCESCLADSGVTPTCVASTGESGAAPDCFKVNPGEGFLVRSTAPAQYPVPGTDTSTAIDLLKLTPLVSLSGTNLISLRYAATATDAKTLMDDIGFANVLSVSRYLSASDSFQVYTGRKSGGLAFPITPGVAYAVRMASTVSYTATAGAGAPIACSTSPTTYYVNGVATTSKFSFSITDPNSNICWSNCADLTVGGNATLIASELEAAINLTTGLAPCTGLFSAVAAGNSVTITANSGPVLNLSLDTPDCSNTATPVAACQVSLTGSCTFNPTVTVICGPDGLPCDDGSACTMNDSCLAGACAGTPVNCNDGDLCTADSCNGATGICQHVAAPCDDGNVCTFNDTCASNVCSGVPITAPGLIASLRVQAGTFTWDAVGGTGIVYDVARGLISELPVGSNVFVETCVAPSTPSTSYSDPDPPPVDDGFWYVVRAKNACGSGDYADINSLPRPTPTCP